MRDPGTGVGRIENSALASLLNRAVGSNLAIFALPSFAGQPQLRIARNSGGGITLVWPDIETSWQLKASATQLPESWEHVTQPTRLIHGRRELDINLGEPLRFFRLSVQRDH